MKYIFKLIIILLTFTLVSYDQKHFLNIPGEVEKVLVEAERQRQKENEVSLVSAKGVDYRKLRDLLKAKKWKEADAETRIVMLKVASKLRGGWRKVGQWLSYEKHNYRDKFEIHDVGHLLPAGALPTHTFANNLESRRDSPEIRRIAKSNPNNHLGFFCILSTTILFNCI